VPEPTATSSAPHEPASAGRASPGTAALGLEDPERTLRRLEWTVLRRLDGLLQGDYRTLFHGQGVDLAELREYTAEDDVRHIDWNVTARMDTPYVRTYHEDRELTAQFLLDLSPSVDFGTARREKGALLVDFVGVLARLLTRQGNRIGAVLYGDGVERVVPALRGRRQVLALLNDLARRRRLARARLTSLGALLEAGLRTLTRRSLVFVVSDFISTAGWEKPLGMLARRHEVLAIRLVDPRERELPDIGPVVLEDAETGEQLVVDTRDGAFRRRFADAARMREAALAATFARARVDVLTISTDDDLVPQIVRFAAERRRRARLRAGAVVA